MATPFMTCSARLPIYALLIAAFVPNLTIGFANLQGLVLFGLYILGILGGIATALLLRKSALRGPKPSFVLALPEFRMPNVRTVLMKLADRAWIFLRRAGTYHHRHREDDRARPAQEDERAIQQFHQYRSGVGGTEFGKCQHERRLRSAQGRFSQQQRRADPTQNSDQVQAE